MVAAWLATGFSAPFSNRRRCALSVDRLLWKRQGTVVPAVDGDSLVVHLWDVDVRRNQIQKRTGEPF